MSDERPSTLRWHLAIISISVLFSAALPCLAGFRLYAFRNYPDDALFYHLIARNIAGGMGSTTDGLGWTNGYQPLWMVVMSGLSSVFHDTIPPAVLLQYAMSIGTLFLLYRFIGHYAGPHWAVVGTLLASFEQSYFHVLYCGMESGVAALLMLASLALLRGASPDRPRRLLWLSALLTLVFFARLDGGLLWPAAGVALLMVDGSVRAAPLATRLGALLRLCLLPCCAALAYCGWNLVTYAIPLPVSGAIKGIRFDLIGQTPWSQYAEGAFRRAGLMFSLDSLTRPLRHLMGPSRDTWNQALVTVLALAVIAAALQVLARRKRIDVALTALLGYVALHAAYYTFLQRDVYSLGIGWVRGPELVLIALAGCVALRALAAALPFDVPRIAGPAAAIALAVTGMGYSALRMSRVDTVNDFGVAITDFDAAAGYVQKSIPPDEVLASENIGFLGYLTGRRIVSVDGLANSTDYFRRYLRPQRQFEYFRRHGIRYFTAAMDADRNPEEVLLENYPDFRTDMVETILAFNTGHAASPTRSLVIVKLRWPDPPFRN